MMEDDLLQFLRTEFQSREKARQVLEEARQQVGIRNLEIASQEERRQLAIAIKGELPHRSVARGNIIFAKLLTILKVAIDEQADTTFKLDEKFRAAIERKLKLENFWKEVDKSLMKFELIFNMFWLRAGEAEARGMSHEEVLRLTHKAMNAVKEELEKSYLQLKREFEVQENALRVAHKTQYVSLHDDIAIKPPVDEHQAMRNELKEYIEEFWLIVMKNYAKFEEIFFKTLEKEIAYKKMHLDDSAYIDEVRKKLSFIWVEIENGYKDLAKKLDDFHQRVLATEKPEGQ
ncbi:MAG: hypothetical protein QW594_02295 [Candidatus Woesearchaeota archaeon]